MAAINWSNVEAEAGELKGGVVSDLAQLVILSVVNGAGLSAENFGGEDAKLTRAARILLAAHMATLMLRRGVAGSVTSQSEGGVSQAYALALANPRVLDLTSYGNLLRQLAMGTPARAGLVVG